MSGIASARGSVLQRRPLFSAVTVWGLAYVVVGIGLATAAAYPLYDAPRALVVGLGGGALGVLLAVLTRALRWGVLLSAVAALVVYLVVAVPLAIPSALGSVPSLLGGLRDAVLGVALGWKQILTLGPPLGEYQAVLIPFLVVMFFGAFAATALVLDDRRRAALAVVVVSAMSVFGIAFGLSGVSATLTLFGIVLPAPREWVIGVAVFAAGLAWSIGVSRLRRSRALRAVAAQNVTRRAAPVWLGIRRQLLAGALVILALVAGVAIAPAASGWSDRSVLRDEIEPMVVVQQQTSPLGAYRSWFAADRLDETVFTVNGDPRGLERVRIATLDEYDGEVFHVSADNRFTRLPRAAEAADRIALELTIGDAYRGIWVPTPAGLAQAPDFQGSRSEALSDGFHLDADGDTAITIADAPGGRVGLEPGDRYELLIDEPTDAASLAEVRGGEPTLDSEAHPALAEWAAMQELPRTGAGFLELIDRLRERGYLSHSVLDDASAEDWIAALKASEGYAFAPSYAGHSTARIEELFTSLIEQERRAGADATPAMLVAAVGDDEQFATAAALLARLWGLESRVVVGVRLPAAEEVPGVPACETECTGQNLTAWVEVRAAGGEWTAVDATPQFAQLPSTITEGEQLPEHPTVPEQPRSESLDPPQAQSDSRNDELPAEAVASDTLATILLVARIVGLSLLALALLLLPAIVILVAKRLRTRSRRSAEGAELRLVGAWVELVDVYADHGILMSSEGTRVLRARSVDRPAAAQLAGLVDRAVFAGSPPQESDAVTAWSIVDREREALAAGRTRWQRLVSHLRLRSFLAGMGVAGGARLRLPGRGIGTLAVAGARRQEEDA